MKRLIALLTTVVVTAVSSAFSSPDATAEETHHDNVLITYFSRAGENYSVGIVERGNTDLLVEIVAEETGGELFRIETVREYPSAYDETSSATITTDQSAVLETYERFEQAMIDKDIDTLNDLVTADKTFTHMSGKVQTKEEFFGEIADGTLNYYSYKLNSPVVTVDGDTALLTGSTTLEAKVYGASGTWTLKTNQHFVKQDGKWLLTDK